MRKRQRERNAKVANYYLVTFDVAVVVRAVRLSSIGVSNRAWPHCPLRFCSQSIVTIVGYISALRQSVASLLRFSFFSFFMAVFLADLFCFFFHFWFNFFSKTHCRFIRNDRQKSHEETLSALHDFCSFTCSRQWIFFFFCDFFILTFVPHHWGVHWH